MARIRTVKPDLFGSYTLASVPVEARYLFVGLFTEADDEGLLIDSAKRLAGAIFPHDEKVSAAKVDGWLNALNDVGSIFRYSAEDGRYIYLPKWLDHQRISHATPTKFPKPSGIIPERLGKVIGWLPEKIAPEGEQGSGRGTGNGN